MRVLIKAPTGEPRRLELPAETLSLLASVLDERPTEPTVSSLVQRLLRKAGEEDPFLTDAEVALLTDVQAALPGVDLSALERAAREWDRAFQTLLPAAQKGLATVSRLVRGMFRAQTQEEFQKRVAHWLDALSEEDRVPVVEFILEVVDGLIELVQADATEPPGDNYLDHHLFYQLYSDTLAPARELRGKALVLRRLHVLSKTVEGYRF